MSAVAQTTTYAAVEPASSRSFVRRLRELAACRELLWTLAWRDIRVRYKHSLLGAAWAVLPPALMMLVFTFVFAQVVQVEQERLTGSASLPYALFAFSGLVPWMFFANGLSGAVHSLVANRPLVTKVYFPREVFPLAAIVSAFVDFLVAGAVLVGLVIAMHAAPNGWHWSPSWALLHLPVVVLVQVAFMTGLGLMLSMANLFYRDVGFVFRAVIQLWMFVTCVVYQLDSATGWKRAVIAMNPMTPIIQGYRDCLLAGRWPYSAAFLNAAVVALIVLLAGAWWFRRREFEFGECI